MAYATLSLENPRTGQIRHAPVGFSWTTLFFGPIPAIMRGHWTLAVAIGILALMTAVVSDVVFAFIYNKMYVRHLVDDGFKATGGTIDIDALEGKLSMRLPRI